MEKKNVYQMVTERVINQMEKGIIPWQQPWTGVGGAINYVSRKPYSMLNQMILGRDGEWLTFNQIQSLGGKIKKGAKAGMVVFYTKYTYTKKTESEDGMIAEEKTIPLLRYYNVFHLDDCEGIESKLNNKQGENLKPVERAEEIINGYVKREKGLLFQNTIPSDKAFYRPSEDAVVVPMINQYAIVEEYYSTTFHELTHSTMKETRCNRKEEIKLAAFGSADYSREELVAELGAAMLCSISNLDNEKAFRNSVAYLQGWLKALKSDAKMLIWAASRAEKAVKYIVGE